MGGKTASPALQEEDSAQRMGLVIELRCETCHRAGKLSLYDDETGRNLYTRGLEHKSAMWLEDEENTLRKHCVLEQGGQPAELSMKEVGIHRSCLVRQVNKAVRIMISEAGCIMNSKSDFHSAPFGENCPHIWTPRGTGDLGRART